MKQALIAVVLFALSVVPAAAAGPYFGASVGGFVPHEADLSAFGEEVDVEYDTGMGFDVKGGYDFDGFRLEGEFGYKNADVDKVEDFEVDDADLTIMSFMFNAFADMKTGTPLTPFVGAGIGFLNGEVEEDDLSTDDTVFGYQLTAGLAYAVTPNLNLELYYRFQGAGSDFEDDEAELSYTSSNINVGVRWAF